MSDQSPVTLDFPVEQMEEMRKKENRMESTLYTALAQAQSKMGKAQKDATNPHFKSKYADLASVMDACMPALSEHGIAVLQPLHDEDGKMYVKTVLVHGETSERAECRVPLIVGKNDMQGYGSAVTYARRYGLMAMAGIAPDDDDGNAAAANAPKYSTSANMKRQLTEIDKDLMDAHSEAELNNLWRQWAKIMNEENWPPAEPDDETAYRNIAKDRFGMRKSYLQSEAEKQPQAEAAE